LGGWEKNFDGVGCLRKVVFCWLVPFGKLRHVGRVSWSCAGAWLTCSGCWWLGVSVPPPVQLSLF
jgi:hypothetical protein